MLVINFAIMSNYKVCVKMSRLKILKLLEQSEQTCMALIIIQSQQMQQ